MADHFEGFNSVELQPNDRNYPIKLTFNPASASSVMDGSIPYGSTLQSIISSVKDQSGIDATTNIISSSLISGNSAIVYLNHSSNVADGLYTLTVQINCSLAGSTLIYQREFDLRRIYLRNE